MGDGQKGLAGAGGADAEDEFGTIERANIGVLVGRSREYRLLARRYLRGGEFRWRSDGRQRKLVVGRDRHAERPFDVGRHGLLAAGGEPVIEIVERAARLFRGDGFAADGHLVSLRTDVDAKTLLDQGQVLVELAVERAGVIVVVEAQDDVCQIRGTGGYGIHVGFCRSSLKFHFPVMRHPPEGCSRMPC